MGRTVPTYRRQLEKEHQRWQIFRAALRAEDQPVFDALFQHSREYADAGSAAARACPSEALFMSMLVGLCKEVLRLRQVLTPRKDHAPEEKQDHEDARHLSDSMIIAPRSLLTMLPYPHLKR
jgi:hypothetical protein